MMEILWRQCIKNYMEFTKVTNLDWIGLAQVRDRWRTLVNAVMNLRFP